MNTPAELQHHWNTRAGWIGDVQAAREFVQRALEAGELLLACDATNWLLGFAEGKVRPSGDGFGRHEGDAILRAALADACTQLGSTERARKLLDELIEDASPDPRAVKLRGRTWQADWERAHPEDRGEFLKLALEDFRAAHTAAPEDLEAASAAAMLACLAGESSTAAQLAEELLERCPDAAARAIALAVLGRDDEARAAFCAAREQGDVRAQTRLRRHARWIAEALFGDAAYFDGCFPGLRAIIFSGHVIDPPGLSPPRFPAEAEPRVRALIADKLAELDARVSFSSASCGADILFLEEMLKRPGSSVYIVLPWAPEKFVETSVVFDAAFEPWRSRFDRVLAASAKVFVIGEWDPSSVGYEYCNRVLDGQARLHARALGLDVQSLALWDGRHGGHGGTAWFVNYWRARGDTPALIRLPEAKSASTKTAPLPADAAPAAAPLDPVVESVRATMRQEIKAMLFADIVGYSKLPESAVPAFVAHFLRRVARLVAESPHAPVSVRTWGDAFYFVFASATAAGAFSLDLRDLVNETDWALFGLAWKDAGGLERSLALRTGLHAGPVFLHSDPVVRHLDFTGTHVNRAARIEPVTPPGQVFASEEFAALAASEGARDFSCDYVGTTELAKDYGRFRLYRLRRTRPAFRREAFARVIHEEYCREATGRGETPETNAALRPWSGLPSKYREACRAQAHHIPAKLRALGCQLVTGSSEPFDFTADEIETLARWEHRRWCEDRISQGWTFGPVRDNARKIHPQLIPWERLSELERDKDRDTVRNLPQLVALAGMRLQRQGLVGGEPALGTLRS